MNIDEAKQQLEHAWMVRTSQDLETTLRITSSLKCAIGFPRGELHPDDFESVNERIPDLDVTSGLWLLSASIARAQRRFDYAKTLILSLENYFASPVVSGILVTTISFSIPELVKLSS